MRMALFNFLLFQALVPKLKDQDPNPGVVTSVLAAIGELAQVGFVICYKHTTVKTYVRSRLQRSCLFQVSGVEMRKYIDELFLVIIDMLQDASSLAKREVCIFLNYTLTLFV